MDWELIESWIFKKLNHDQNTNMHLKTHNIQLNTLKQLQSHELYEYAFKLKWQNMQSKICIFNFDKSVVLDQSLLLKKNM